MRYAAEDCPVNRMKDRDAGAWDACFSQQLNLGFHD